MELLKPISTCASTQRTTPSATSWSTPALTFFNTGVGDDGWRLLKVVPSILRDLARRRGRESFRKAPHTIRREKLSMAACR